MSNNDLFYNMFIRAKPPSILRLACMQLIKEGVNFADESKRDKIWELIWDRAEYILKNVHKNKKAKQLHQTLIDLRANV